MRTKEDIQRDIAERYAIIQKIIKDNKRGIKSDENLQELYQRQKRDMTELLRRKYESQN